MVLVPKGLAGFESGLGLASWQNLCRTWIWHGPGLNWLSGLGRAWGCHPMGRLGLSLAWGWLAGWQNLWWNLCWTWVRTLCPNDHVITQMSLDAFIMPQYKS